MRVSSGSALQKRRGGLHSPGNAPAQAAEPHHSATPPRMQLAGAPRGLDICLGPACWREWPTHCVPNSWLTHPLSTRPVRDRERKRVGQRAAHVKGQVELGSCAEVARWKTAARQPNVSPRQQRHCAAAAVPVSRTNALPTACPSCADSCPLRVSNAQRSLSVQCTQAAAAPHRLTQAHEGCHQRGAQHDTHDNQRCEFGSLRRRQPCR